MCWILHDDIYNNWYTSWTEHFASANLRWFFSPVISWPCSSLYNLLESIQLSVSSRRRQRRTNERKNSKSDLLQRLKCMMKEMYGAKLWTLNMCLFSHIFYYTLYSSMSPLLFDFYLCCVFFILFCFVGAWSSSTNFIRFSDCFESLMLSSKYCVRYAIYTNERYSNTPSCMKLILAYYLLCWARWYTPTKYGESFFCCVLACMARFWWLFLWSSSIPFVGVIFLP